ncbi:MAG: hypothetical protein AAF902_18855 [Chloroflexota bacterium]
MFATLGQTIFCKVNAFAFIAFACNYFFDHAEWILLTSFDLTITECHAADIPLLLEPICYSVDPVIKKSDAKFAKEFRPSVIIESAHRLSRLGATIMKMEFPSDPNHEFDEVIMEKHCGQLTEAIDIPWVLLSAGVHFSQFVPQVKIACRAGASGFVAGRAIWKEGCTWQMRWTVKIFIGV